MSTTTEFLSFPQGRADDFPARLRLKDADAPRGLLDGAWWPRSRDLCRELPALAEVLSPLRDRISRIAVNPLHWPVVPRKIAVPGRVIKVGWFAEELDPHKVLLRTRTGDRWDLLVIPPQTGAVPATRLMAAACDAAGPPRTASMIIADEESRQDVPAADRLEDLWENWEYEGGASSTHPAFPLHRRAVA